MSAVLLNRPKLNHRIITADFKMCEQPPHGWFLVRPDLPCSPDASPMCKSTNKNSTHTYTHIHTHAFIASSRCVAAPTTTTCTPGLISGVQQCAAGQICSTAETCQPGTVRTYGDGTGTKHRCIKQAQSSEQNESMKLQTKQHKYPDNCQGMKPRI